MRVARFHYLLGLWDSALNNPLFLLLQLSKSRIDILSRLALRHWLLGDDSLNTALLLRDSGAVLGLNPFQSLLVKVPELTVNVIHLSVGQEVCLSANDIMDGVDLIHHYVVGIVVVERHGFDNLLQEWVTELIVAALSKLEVLNAAQEFE